MASLIHVSTIIAMCIATISASTPFTPCTEGLPPLELRVDGCTAPPCIWNRGTNATAEWDFYVTADSDRLTPRVQATVLGFTTTYSIGQDNACDTIINGECPVDKGEELTYALTMPILSSYPRISLTVEFAFVDDHNDVQVCFRLNARVN